MDAENTQSEFSGWNDIAPFSSMPQSGGRSNFEDGENIEGLPSM